MSKANNRPMSIKQLNKEMRKLKTQLSKTVNPDTQRQLQNQIIQIISNKNKVKKGISRIPKTPKKKRQVKL